jgi:hypothetical protein
MPNNETVEQHLKDRIARIWAAAAARAADFEPRSRAPAAMAGSDVAAPARGQWFSAYQPRRSR